MRKGVNYYKNPSNYSIEPNPPTTNFYYKVINKNNSTVTMNQSQTTLSGEFIEIDNKRLYVTIIPANSKNPFEQILFSTPTDVIGDGKLWDFHYHFGLRTDFVRKVKIKGRIVKQNYGVIYFHKTSQDPSNGEFIHSNCYFIEDVDINDVSSISCTTKYDYMSTKFPLDTEDFMFIEEIIKRPFFGVQKGGHKKKRKTIRRKKRSSFRKRTRRRKNSPLII